jgi:chromosomal replication initiator protein
MEKTHTQLWAECCQFIKDNITPQQYESWFSPISSVGFTDGNLLLLVPSSFFADQLEERHLDVLRAGIKKVYGTGVKLYYRYFTVQNDPAAKVTQLSSAPSPTIMAQHSQPVASPFQRQNLEGFDPQLNPRYTFENYCASLSNQIARSIGETIANNPSIKTFNPLFIFGPTGVGKTHLIQAIGIRIKEQNPQARVLYVTARLFESQYTAAVAKGSTNSFFHFYQSIDTLIVDDIQDLHNKPGTQNTFYHIFNHLRQNNKQIILSSDRAPSEMDGFESRMLSRFKGGLSAELSRPDITLRREVLVQKAEQDGLFIPNEVIDFVATNVTDSIRELEGVVVSLVAHATVLNRDINVDLARNVIANAVRISRRQVNFEMITQAVSNHFGLEADKLFTKSRKREISDARQLVMYLAKKLTKMPMTAIGHRIDRTHATVIYACKNIEERISIEKKLADDVKAIEEAIMS